MHQNYRCRGPWTTILGYERLHVVLQRSKLPWRLWCLSRWPTPLRLENHPLPALYPLELEEIMEIEDRRTLPVDLKVFCFDIHVHVPFSSLEVLWQAPFLSTKSWLPCLYTKIVSVPVNVVILCVAVERLSSIVKSLKYVVLNPVESNGFKDIWNCAYFFSGTCRPFCMPNVWWFWHPHIPS